MDSSFGIRADDLGRRGIVLKEGNCGIMAVDMFDSQFFILVVLFAFT